MTWDTSNTIATVAAAVAIISLAFALYQWWKSSHEGKIQALQGSKESVAYMARRLRKGQLPSSTHRLGELIDALCLAAIFERSGRSRILVYRALSRVHAEYPDELRRTIQEIEKDFDKYKDYTDLSRGRKRLTKLKKALCLSSDEHQCDNANKEPGGT